MLRYSLLQESYHREAVGGCFFCVFSPKKALESLLEMILLVTKSGRVQNKFKAIIFSP